MTKDDHSAVTDLDEAVNAINRKTGRNMPQAIATGAILITVITLSFLFNPQPFIWLIVIFMVIGLWELRIDFAVAGLRIPVAALWVCSAAVLLGCYYAPAGYHFAAAVTGIIITLFIVLLFASFNRQHSKRAARAILAKINTGMANDATVDDLHAARPQRYLHIAASILTVFYIPFLASFIVLPITMKHYVAHAVLLVFIPALGDTGGLLFGAALGRHKLSERISPKKTVEGMIGSVLFTVVGTLAVGLCTYTIDELRSKWWILLILGILLGIAGMFGDLCASMLKRDLGIKDMGHLLKGHGGVLDRVDSILMCAPVTFFTVFFFGL